MHNNMNVNVSGPVQAPAMQSYQAIVLKYNIVDGHNLLTQEMMSQENTIYVIKWDFELAENITIPANCVLEFDGGSISGEHTITGNDTGIEAGLVKIFNTDVTLAGTWNVAEAYPEWFGAKGDGVHDDAEQTQKAINFAQLIKGTVKFSNKEYAISTIVLSDPVRIIGTTNKNAVGFATDKILYTKIIPIHTTVPCIRLNFTSVTGGIVIKDLSFIYNVEELTVLPYIISDSGSQSWASGIIIENIMFKNAYNGIQLHHAERFTIRDINGDFANNFLDIDTSRDVSIIENIHIHNFSNIESYATFRRSTSSDYAIKMNVVDEIFITNVFIWDRHKGFSFNKVWGTISNITTDGVNKLFYIQDLSALGLSIENIHYIGGFTEKPEEFNVIDMIYSGPLDDVETRVSIKNADFRSNIATPNMFINMDFSYPVTIENATFGCFGKHGIYITSCKCGIFNNIRFVYSGTIDPISDRHLGYNIVNNDSNHKMIFSNIISEVGKKLYDGYYKNVEFDRCISLTSTVYASNGSETISQDGTLIIANTNYWSHIMPKCCYPSVVKDSIIGVVYKVLETLNINAKSLVFKIGTTEIITFPDRAISDDYRLTLICSDANGVIDEVYSGYISQGQMLIKNVFVGESNRLAIPNIDGDTEPFNGYIGTTYKQWVKAGQMFTFSNKLYYVKSDGFPSADDNSIAVKIADL